MQLVVLVLGLPLIVRFTLRMWQLRSLAELCHRVCAQASSEELRLSAVQALGALVKGSCTDVLLAEDNAPLLGHALSLLLQVADSEAAAGDRGSRTLRAEAFRALELLLRQVRTRIKGSLLDALCAHTRC